MNPRIIAIILLGVGALLFLGLLKILPSYCLGANLLGLCAGFSIDLNLLLSIPLLLIGFLLFFWRGKR